MAVTSTAHDVIRLAMKMAGVLVAGQTLTAEDANDALLLLNSMIATWNQNRWMVYHLVDVACPSTQKQSYSVGPGGDFNVPRPDRLQYAYARLNPTLGNGDKPLGYSPVDYPLTVVETHEEYAAISLKQLVSFPSCAFYDATLGLGTLYVWPIPQDFFELHIVVKETLGEFATLDQPISFPPEYYECILYNLAGRLQLLYRQPIDGGIVALANSALNTVKVANHRVGSLRMPSAVGRVGSGSWPAHGVGGMYEGTFTLGEDDLG